MNRFYWVILFGMSMFQSICHAAEKQLANPQNIKGLYYGGPLLNDDSFGYSMGADYILWLYVVEGYPTAVSNVEVTRNAYKGFGSFNEPIFPLLNGFKVYGSVLLKENQNMDIKAKYTWLQRTTKTTTGQGGGITLAISNLLDGTRSEDFLLSSWATSTRLVFNLINIDAGRNCILVEDALNFRPYVGIVGVYNKNTFTSLLNSSGFPSAQPFVSVQIMSIGAGGARAGFNMDWTPFLRTTYLKEVKFCAEAALSGIFGQTKIDTTNSNGGVVTSLSKDYLYRSTPIVEFQIGFGWNKLFGSETNDRYNFEFHALWELQNWIGYNRFYNPGYSFGNLTLQGLTLGASLDF
jgi:hypothetical protein